MKSKVRKTFESALAVLTIVTTIVVLIKNAKNISERVKIIAQKYGIGKPVSNVFEQISFDKAVGPWLEEDIEE